MILLQHVILPIKTWSHFTILLLLLLLQLLLLVATARATTKEILKTSFYNITLAFDINLV